MLPITPSDGPTSGSPIDAAASHCLFTQMPDGFALHEMIFDAEGKAVDYRFLAVNPAFEEMTGLSAKELIGRTALEVLPGTDARSIENYGNVALTGAPWRFESSRGRLNKLFDVQAYRPQEGRFACIFRDITEQRAGEAESRAERAVFEGAREGILRTSPEGRILAANPAVSKTLGYDCALQLIQLNGGSVHPVWADPEERSRFLRRVEEWGFVHGQECRLRRKDGTLVRVSLSGRKVNGPDGTAYYVEFVEDITARKQKEEELQASENKFKMAFMTGADAAAISSIQDGVILEVNDRFTELFGYSRDEACGRTSTELGCYADSDRHRLLAELKANGHAESLEFQARRKDGELRSVLVSANPLQNGGSGLLLSVVRDVTGQKCAEAEKTKLEDQFRQAQKLESIGRMAAGIAHDFNNLLTVINGYGDLLLHACKSGDPLREWIEEIRKAGERAVNLVRQLLAFSRKQTPEPRRMYPHSLVIESQSMLRRLIGEQIELVIESDSSGWPVMADPGQLHQVLMNLVVNARDAMPRGGTLAIRTANVEVDGTCTDGHSEIAPGEYVSLLVSDSGVGIAKEIRQHIFDPFFTTKEEGEGTGLGLSTVYGIVRQLGGSIEVSSEPGCGATFEVYLPRLEDEAMTGAEAASVRASARGSETVLVVEDQEPVRKLTVTVMKENGYVVLGAANGNDALLAAGSHAGPIHLLLTDVVMPHMTGKELADRLKPLRPEMKVLYMSGYAADAIAGKGLLESGAPYIAKPFTPDVLAAKVREVLTPARPAAAILVVDDEESVRGFFEQVLVGAGYDVVAASDGAEALETVRKRRFDLLLTDLVMPEREGLELIMMLRKERPELKVVAVSGAFGGTFLEVARAMGARAALLKPVSPGQLLAAVQEALS